MDYSHDELAMSPELDEADLENRSQVMFCLRLQSMINIDHQSNATSETVQIFSSGVVTPHSEHQEQSETKKKIMITFNQEMRKVSM